MATDDSMYMGKVFARVVVVLVDGGKTGTETSIQEKTESRRHRKRQRQGCKESRKLRNKNNNIALCTLS